eukprot:CAMPEP_0172531722 /NCGR_PEP_ID=MMETSP1067-20121228/5005_1 /TAXON_ID=265564 ORGANISM="Thalassiosira punctigera, Strain Tpunct2005C2" /NCGR_SAMPLE_ID=MMETSP1067 /ASSEMBLY_ACC=CAM_ASM_000444 /LENGTH=389 /DNA_ID=CAMNT_0013316125 /DNA_START=191 /DNA_END=1360 /DNA_ORIENTATION=+
MAMASRPDRNDFQTIAMLHLIVALFCFVQSSSAFGFPAPFVNTKAANGINNNSDRLSKIPIVICPGFGNDQIDYLNPLDQGDEFGFVSALSRRGFNPDLIQVLPLDRIEWFRVAGGLFDIPNFYTGNCRPEGLGYGWYVKRLRKTIEEAYVKAGGEERVILVGHSAGGWLARAALGDGSWDAEDGEPGDNDSNSEVRASDRVRALITIGAIHKPPAGNAASTCVTRGALSYLDQTYPGAYLSKEGVAYVSVGGDAVLGRRQVEVDGKAKTGSEEVNNVYEVRGEGSASSVAYTSYGAVSGNGEMTGDGVVPLEWSLLEGSSTIVLDGVLHSINEAGTTMPTDRWYGADKVVDRWLVEALEEAGISVYSSKSGNEFPLKNMFDSIFAGQK